MTTNTTTNTLGTTCGRAIGSTAAHLGHFMARGATGVANFSGDAGRGALSGYADTAARRSAERLMRAAAREAAGQPQTPIGVLVTA